MAFSQNMIEEGNNEIDDDGNVKSVMWMRKNFDPHGNLSFSITTFKVLCSKVNEQWKCLNLSSTLVPYLEILNLLASPFSYKDNYHFDQLLKKCLVIKKCFGVSCS
jgi:hypothetical protein